MTTIARDSNSTCASALADDKNLARGFFEKHDLDSSGKLDRTELQGAIGEIMDEQHNVDMKHVETVFREFDKDGDGKIDFCEYQTMLKYLSSGSKDVTYRKSSVIHANSLASFAGLDFGDDADSSINNMSGVLDFAITQSKRDNKTILKDIVSALYPVRRILCVQDKEDKCGGEVDFDNLMFQSNIDLSDADGIDPDFESAFPPSAMRCLALVSHNGMKSTMQDFVLANRNLLKKFRLTGTESTMTMLADVFSDEAPGTVMYGPSCSSGPLGGDAELVAHMVGGKIGGIFFFQDPMNSHPHRADIDCLVRQALVHNTMISETPTSALMITHCLREALQGEGKPEMIPTFFFSLQCPSVAAYKTQQKKVVAKKKAEKKSNFRRESMVQIAQQPRGTFSDN